jgi:hypothetical protein
VPLQQAPRAPAQRDQRGKVLLETGHRRACRSQQLPHLGVTRCVRGFAPFLDLAQPVMQGVDELAAPFRIVDQVVLQERIALDHPDVAQHLIEHAGRTPGAALAAQFIEQPPGRPAQQANDDFPVREGGVVIGDLAQPRVRARFRGMDGAELGQIGNGIHGARL